MSEAIHFVFIMAEELKRSYGVPVILVTMEDYAEKLFDILVEIRRAMLMKSSTARFAEIVTNVHTNWLKAIEAVEQFKNRLESTPQDVYTKAIEYTIVSVNNRYKSFKQYVIHIEPKMELGERTRLHADIEIAGEMCASVVSELKGKENSFKQKIDRSEYLLLANDEVNELLHWIDLLTDYVVIQVKHVIFTPQNFLNQLASVSCDLIGDVVDSACPEKNDSLGIHKVKATHDLEMYKLADKLKVLNEKIKTIKAEDPADRAWELKRHEFKAEYMRERLRTLQNLKETLNVLGMSMNIPSKEDISENKVNIFHHMLPSKQRSHLVEKLLNIWHATINVNSPRKSIVSILSPSDINETYSDVVGKFLVDRYSRKLYIIPGDERLYQLDHNNDLVLVDDDDEHIYYYDSCGRYYLNKETNERTYKADGTASEYVMHDNGKLVKVKEERDGKIFYFDDYGRYQVYDDDLKVYHNTDSESEYELDGLGNLVRKRSDFSQFESCTNETTYIEESIYLKQAVGAALRKCVAETILQQPHDPINFLADSLEKYQRNKEMSQDRQDEEMAMFQEREKYDPENSVVISPKTSLGDGESSSSFIDSNLFKYKSLAMDDI